MPRKRSGILFDISHFMTEDGPGIRTVFFVKGCPLRCKWCSNAYGLSFSPQLAVLRARCSSCGRCIPKCPRQAITISDTKKEVTTDFSQCSACGQCMDICPNDARTIIGRDYTPEDILHIAEKDRDFYKSSGGITFSGGEVMSQANFVAQSLQLCREHGISTAIETSAFGSWDNLFLLLSRVDFAFIDVKHMDDDAHIRLTGVSNRLILDNIHLAAEYCDKHNVCLVLRFPLIPGENDDGCNIRQLGQMVQSLPGDLELNILPYHEYGVGKYENIGQVYAFEGDVFDLSQSVEMCRQIFKELGICFSIGGGNVISY